VDSDVKSREMFAQMDIIWTRRVDSVLVILIFKRGDWMPIFLAIVQEGSYQFENAI
jgi:hypothetical protein